MATVEFNTFKIMKTAVIMSGREIGFLANIAPFMKGKKKMILSQISMQYLKIDLKPLSG